MAIKVNFGTIVLYFSYAFAHTLYFVKQRDVSCE